MKNFFCWERKRFLLCGFLFFAFISAIFTDRLCAEAATDLNTFPASYKPYIQQLMAEHPNWTFEAYETNVSWSDAMRYETETGVNLIEYGSGDADSWYAKDQNVTYNGKKINLYNFSTRKYYILSEPNWIQPTDEVIAYYLDPRNFLNSSDIFMFEYLVYNADYHTEQNVEAILTGSWMYKAKLEDNAGMTYAQAFVKIGKEIGVSPFLLASRVVQEQGLKGELPLISGTYAGFEGYYNYFNINATGETREEIYKNGLTEAKNAGWNTRYKALYGGAQKIASRYLDYKQNTIYFQKFDVANGKVSWHQYMQNIQAPFNEGRRIRNAYADCGIFGSGFVFLIPIYRNMPSSACTAPQTGQTTQPTRPSTPPTIGDIDQNGKVEAADALAVLQYVVHLKTFDSVQLERADTDGNGVVDAYDALRILQYVVFIIYDF